MIEFENLEQLKNALNIEATKQTYKEQEERERADEEKELKKEFQRLRAERLRQQVAKENKQAQQEQQQAQAREKQRKSDNIVCIISLLFTFLSVAASVILFLVLILKF